MTNKKIVLLPCAGSGSRFGGSISKQYMPINGKTILEHTLSIFISLELIDKIVIVAATDDEYIDTLLAEIMHSAKFNSSNIQVEVLKVGGKTRADSVKNGLRYINCDANDWILVHDVARCCVTREAVLRLIKTLESDLTGGILAIPATDTIKQSVDGLIIDSTLTRSMIYQAQTPQMFRFNILKQALNLEDLSQITDEASGVEAMGISVKLVIGEMSNIKITYPLDIEFAKIILNDRS